MFWWKNGLRQLCHGRPCYKLGPPRPSALQRKFCKSREKFMVETVHTERYTKHRVYRYRRTLIYISHRVANAAEIHEIWMWLLSLWEVKKLRKKLRKLFYQPSISQYIFIHIFHTVSTIHSIMGFSYFSHVKLTDVRDKIIFLNNKIFLKYSD